MLHSNLGHQTTTHMTAGKNLSTDLRSTVSIKKQRQSLSVVLVFSNMSYCQQGLGKHFACSV